MTLGAGAGLGAVMVAAPAAAWLQVAPALGVPISASIYWMHDPGAPRWAVPVSVSMRYAAWRTAACRVSAAAPGTAWGMPVAVLATRHTWRPVLSGA